MHCMARHAMPLVNWGDDGRQSRGGSGSSSESTWQSEGEHNGHSALSSSAQTPEYMLWGRNQWDDTPQNPARKMQPSYGPSPTAGAHHYGMQTKEPAMPRGGNPTTPSVQMLSSYGETLGLGIPAPAHQLEHGSGELHRAGGMVSAEQLPPVPPLTVLEHFSDFVRCTMDIPPEVVGWVIGRSGQHIKEMKHKSGCGMWVKQEELKLYMTASDMHRIHYAARLVADYISKAPVNLSSRGVEDEVVSHTVECPSYLIGLLIGKGGSTIKRIKEDSGANVVINQKMEQVHVSGMPQNVGFAVRLIEEVFSYGRSADQNGRQPGARPELGENEYLAPLAGCPGDPDDFRMYDGMHKSVQRPRAGTDSSLAQYEMSQALRRRHSDRTMGALPGEDSSSFDFRHRHHSAPDCRSPARFYAHSDSGDEEGWSIFSAPPGFNSAAEGGGAAESWTSGSRVLSRVPPRPDRRTSQEGDLGRAPTSSTHPSRAMSPASPGAPGSRSTAGGASGKSIGAQPVMELIYDGMADHRGMKKRSGSFGSTASLTNKHKTLSTFLQSLGLIELAPVFERNEIDMAAMGLMGQQDFADIGIPKGPRLKMINRFRGGPEPPPFEDFGFTMAALLSQLGLSKYQAALRDASLDLAAMVLMTEDDFAEVGLPKGPRLKVMAELQRLAECACERLRAQRSTSSDQTRTTASLSTVSASDLWNASGRAFSDAEPECEERNASDAGSIQSPMREVRRNSIQSQDENVTRHTPDPWARTPPPPEVYRASTPNESGGDNAAASPAPPGKGASQTAPPGLQQIKLCGVCNDRRADVVLVECGHRAACTTCVMGARLQGKCPECHVQVTHYQPVPLAQYV